MMEYFVVVFIYKMQQLEIGCVGNIISKILSTAKKERQLYTYLPGRDFLLYPGERCPGDTPQTGIRYLWVFECIQ